MLRDASDQFRRGDGSPNQEFCDVEIGTRYLSLGHLEQVLEGWIVFGTFFCHTSTCGISQHVGHRAALSFVVVPTLRPIFLAYYSQDNPVCHHFPKGNRYLHLTSRFHHPSMPWGNPFRLLVHKPINCISQHWCALLMPNIAPADALGNPKVPLISHLVSSHSTNEMGGTSLRKHPIVIVDRNPSRGFTAEYQYDMHHGISLFWYWLHYAQCHSSYS